MRYFGSSGIRGIYGEKVTIDLFTKVGKAIGSMGSQIAVGYDHRSTSPMLSAAISSGAMASGADVVMLGLVPTPVTAFWARKGGYGAMITASHNPPEYNGVKLWNSDGLSFITEQMNTVEDLIDSSPVMRSWDGVGVQTEPQAVLAPYLDWVVSTVSLERPLKVVVDCGNGATSEAAPRLLRMLGCETTAINSTFDPSFSARPSEPTEEALHDLKEAVKRKGADIGIAHDGDGDRMVAISPEGRYLGGDLLMQLFASMEEVKKAATPVNASMSFDELLGRENIIRTKVGDVFVGEALKNKGGDLGCEPSGTWIFPHHTYCPDGLLAAAKLLEHLSKTDPVNALSSLKTYPIWREKIPLKIPKEEAMKNIKEAIHSLQSENIDTIDGIRADMEWGWVLVRPSGTEPIIRATIEAKNELTLKEEGSKILDIIKGVLA